jgi:molecular chaperone HtpG
MRQAGHEPPPRRRTLELNPAHPLVERLARLAREEPSSSRLTDSADLLLGQALLAEGSPLPDPARFGKLVNELLLAACRRVGRRRRARRGPGRAPRTRVPRGGLDLCGRS